jgi:hypothetical protein
LELSRRLDVGDMILFLYRLGSGISYLACVCFRAMKTIPPAEPPIGDQALAIFGLFRGEVAKLSPVPA